MKTKTEPKAKSGEAARVRAAYKKFCEARGLVTGRAAFHAGPGRRIALASIEDVEEEESL